MDLLQSSHSGCQWPTPLLAKGEGAGLDEVKNLSWKKEAWLRLWDTSSSDSDQHSSALAEYCRFRGLTKVASEKARNAWWSARAAEAENKAKMSQQLNRIL